MNVMDSDRNSLVEVAVTPEKLDAAQNAFPAGVYGRLADTFETLDEVGTPATEITIKMNRLVAEAIDTAAEREENETPA